MSLINRIIVRLKRNYFRWGYQRAIDHILNTKPLERGGLPLTLLSMVHQRDVKSYLVAVKSFAHFANPERIVIVCDPTIRDEDRVLLQCHVPHVELREAHEFVHPDIPRGGTWERLFAISEYVKDGYVVQLDADTLTLQDIPEVIRAVREGKGFVIGEMPNTPIRLLPAVRENALPWMRPGAHIQGIVETEMVNVGLPVDAVYIRGCSGFTGFPQAADMQEKMTDFSRRMSAKMGDDWKRWGTEQVTSNYLVSNAPGTVPLPFPKYGTPDCAAAGTAFLHFIGPMRFINKEYENASRQVIRMICGTAA